MARYFPDINRYLAALEYEQELFRAQVVGGVPKFWDADAGMFCRTTMDPECLGALVHVVDPATAWRNQEKTHCPLTGNVCKRLEDFCDGLTDCCFINEEERE